mgnify:CR=1 FL=1
MDVETLGKVCLIVMGVLIGLVLLLSLGIFLLKHFNTMVKAEFKIREAQDKLVDKYGIGVLPVRDSYMSYSELVI